MLMVEICNENMRERGMLMVEICNEKMRERYVDGGNL